MSLEQYREQIDQLNEKIAEDISERMEVVEKVGEYKKKNDIDVVDEDREEIVCQQFKDLFEEKDLPPERGRQLARLLIDMAVEEEK